MKKESKIQIIIILLLIIVLGVLICFAITNNSSDNVGQNESESREQMGGPMGEPPDGMMGGNMGGNSSSVESNGATEITESKTLQSGEYTSENADQNSILVKGEIESTLEKVGLSVEHPTLIGFTKYKQNFISLIPPSLIS